MRIFSRFGRGAETGPYQEGVGNEFPRDEVSLNMAKNMPVGELEKLIEELRERLDYEEKNNELDNELVEHYRKHLQMLEEVLHSRTEKE